MTNKPKLLVEGWRFLPHSYAIVNQWQLLALGRRDDVEISVRDTPYPSAHWKSTRGVFPVGEEQTIAALPLAAEGDDFDAIFRMGFPYDTRVDEGVRTAMFATSEYQVLPPSHFLGKPDFAALRKNPLFSVVTPSRWSAVACEKLGLSSAQIAVVPHGVDVDVFRPDRDMRTAVRRAMKLEDSFVFFNNGAMTPNKGVDLLLKAFAIVARKRPEARLLLKGLDLLHKSTAHLQHMLGALDPTDRQTILERVAFIDKSLGMTEVAALYQASDAYVSPYRAEGFSIPVLEATASGLPVICTGGGATDDFVEPGSARKIKSQIEDIEYSGLPGRHLLPDFGHLVELMLAAMDDQKWRDQAAKSGPLHAWEYFRWTKVTEKLLNVLLPDRSPAA